MFDIKWKPESFVALSNYQVDRNHNFLFGSVFSIKTNDHVSTDLAYFFSAYEERSSKTKDSV